MFKMTDVFDFNTLSWKSLNQNENSIYQIMIIQARTTILKSRFLRVPVSGTTFEYHSDRYRECHANGDM